MKATWAFWQGRPMYLWYRDWYPAHPQRGEFPKFRYQTAIFMRRWRVIPL